MVAVGRLAQLAHLTQHRDMAARLLPQHRQRRAHGGGIGVVALVDQQRLTALDRHHRPLAPAGQAAELRQRQPGKPQVAAHRIHRRENGQRV